MSPDTPPSPEDDLPPIPADNQEDTKIPVSELEQTAIRELAESISQDTGVITEKDFVEKILPVITDTSGQANLSIWTEYAGIVQRPLKVINEKGEVLFVCPAPLGQLPTLAADDRSDHVAEVVSQSQAQSTLSPRMGANYLDGKLGQRAEAMQPDEHRHLTWLQILAHYGYVNDETPKEALANGAGGQAQGGGNLTGALSDEVDPL